MSTFSNTLVLQILKQAKYRALIEDLLIQFHEWHASFVEHDEHSTSKIMVSKFVDELIVKLK